LVISDRYQGHRGNDTSDKLFTGVNDTGDKLLTGVNDTGDKLFTGVNDTADKFFTGDKLYGQRSVLSAKLRTV
jgi:hypothetical protein